MAVKTKLTARAGKAEAVHVEDKNNERHAVGIWDLHVLIVPDGRFWFPQGLEIDYAAQGDSVSDAKKQFSKGLTATIDLHLKIYGDIRKLLRVAPSEAWQELWTADNVQPKIYSQVSVHEVIPTNVLEAIPDPLPFQTVKYAEVQAAA